MPDEQPEKVWDEYDWERFLQEQDRKTEKYMELMERYMDHPDRDQIVAREMGWHHLLDENGDQWTEKVDALFEDELDELEAEIEKETGELGDEETGEFAFDFEGHPLYQSALAMTLWIGDVLDALGDDANHPAALQISAQSSIVCAKLAAALSDDDIDEIGMTIAYLKRALKAVTLCIEAAAELRRGELIAESQLPELNHRLFHTRDGIITLMGEFRAEWRRRFGAGR